MALDVVFRAVPEGIMADFASPTARDLPASPKARAGFAPAGVVATPGRAEGIAIRDVEMVYRRGNQVVTALSGCDLDIPGGSWVSLIGASGCGKSTLLRILSDIVKPTGGIALLGGMTPAEARAARRFALVSQSAVMLPWRKRARQCRTGAGSRPRRSCRAPPPRRGSDRDGRPEAASRRPIRPSFRAACGSGRRSPAR